MHIHILGIGGTFMSALALLAREAGFEVSGCDANLYPPISTLLNDNAINWVEGYDHTELALSADLIIVGNAIKRGMPVIEAVLNQKKPYVSGPEWLANTILSNYRVIAIAGTHGKTTTTTMTAFILEAAGIKPGFLIGGVAPSFQTSARLGAGDWFIIEADEYDSAFFDKRPKLMHYRPEIAVINNLEFDHADIYSNLEAIEQQFHYYLKTIPADGTVIAPKNSAAIDRVIAKGIYSNFETISTDEADSIWTANLVKQDGSEFDIIYQGSKVATVSWSLIGNFNVENGLAAIAAAYKAGVPVTVAAAALTDFQLPKRRLELKWNEHGITLYDDFAHHPTAIEKTIKALYDSKRHQRILVVTEFASYTMRSGQHQLQLQQTFKNADTVFLFNPPSFYLNDDAPKYKIKETIQSLLDAIINQAKPGDAILVMSNRGFDNIHEKIVDQLNAKFLNA